MCQGECFCISLFTVIFYYLFIGYAGEIMMDMAKISRPLLKQDWMAAVTSLFQTSAPVRLLQELVSETDPEANMVLLYIQGVMSRLCEKTQKVLQQSSLNAMFYSQSLRAITNAVTSVPDFVETLVKGFFSQKLHQFLADYPIPKLERMFPEPFCNRSAVLDKYFDLSSNQRDVINQLCQADWTNIIVKLMEEMIPQETQTALRSNVTSNLTQVWESTGCVVNSLIQSLPNVINYTAPLMQTLGYVQTNWERALELLPRTSILLQLYLQPYLQNYPEFRNFRQLYQHGTKIVNAIYNVPNLSADQLFNTLEEAGYFVKQVLNVTMADAGKDLILIKPYAGKS